jgi:Glucodextranase, domain B/PASTA domain
MLGGGLRLTSTMRLVLLPAAALSAALLTACGGGDAPAPPLVRLAVTTPRDQAVVHEGQVELQGAVRPSSATVTVRGKRAAVAGGTFRATVSLAAGTNVIDVLASAGRARPVLTAIRVRRKVSVRVPDVTAHSVDDARRQLTGLGFKVEVQQERGIFDRLLSRDPTVCAMEPGPGEEIDPGATVRILASRLC